MTIARRSFLKGLLAVPLLWKAKGESGIYVMDEIQKDPGSLLELPPASTQYENPLGWPLMTVSMVVPGSTELYMQLADGAVTYIAQLMPYGLEFGLGGRAVVQNIPAPAMPFRLFARSEGRVDEMVAAMGALPEASIYFMSYRPVLVDDGSVYSDSYDTMLVCGPEVKARVLPVA